MASTRQDLSERQILGEDRLHEDFVARVIIVSIFVSPSELFFFTPLYAIVV